MSTYPAASAASARPGAALLLVLGLSAIASIGVSAFSGEASLRMPDLFALFANSHDSVEVEIFLRLRLPRVITAFVTGGLLALAGVLMQVLLRNPLADPFILGVSGGASVGALGALLLGLSSYLISLGAFVGALASVTLVFWIARGVRGGDNPFRLLLTGVVTASGFSAVVSFMLATAPEARLRGMMFWLMGDLGQATSVGWAPLILLIGVAAVRALSGSLDVLARGDLHASAVGVPLAATRVAIYVLASLLSAAAVSIAGAIGFIGLVVPHMIRLIAGSNHRILAPAAVLLGGALLVTADFLAREMLWPQQIPVGIITALLGVPFFLYLLRRAD